MATTSVLPDVKARLVTLLSTAPGLRDVQVGWAQKGDGLREEIYFARTTGTVTISVMAAGRQRRDERLDLLLVIDTAIPGRSSEEAERRAFELYAVVEDLIAQDGALHPGLPQYQDGVPGVLSAEISTFTAGPDPDIEGYSGLLVANVIVTARLN